MAKRINIRRVLFPVLFALFSFGTGFLLVTASQQNTEGRSKAFDGPYGCTAACSPPTGSIGSASCQACMSGNVPTETPDRDACTYVFDGKCYADEEDARNAEYNAGLRKQVKCYLPGYCDWRKEPTPINP